MSVAETKIDDENFPQIVSYKTLNVLNPNVITINKLLEQNKQVLIGMPSRQNINDKQHK